MLCSQQAWCHQDRLSPHETLSDMDAYFALDIERSLCGCGRGECGGAAATRGSERVGHQRDKIRPHETLSDMDAYIALNIERSLCGCGRGECGGAPAARRPERVGH